jgi:hypothetical protein
MNHVYWFRQDLGISPQRDHHGVAITYQDIAERRRDFIRELRCTITNWVYSKANCKRIIDDRMRSTNDPVNAYMFLNNLAISKFRRGAPQGQFGELLLFNFLQHFFGSIPLLRKMSITTSTGHERFGADALHYSRNEGKNVIYLGESKCYESSYKFNAALEASLVSIADTFNKFYDELDLYTYENFLEPELQEICESLKSGTLPDVHFELVCLIAYNETEKFLKESETAIKDSIKKVIEERCQKVGVDIMAKIDTHLLSRINYIIFPVWSLDELLESFGTK